jgi:hypothetical protein
MNNAMNARLILILLLPFVFWGCDDLFDTGDADAVFDGDPQVEFKPLSQEVSETAGLTTVAVQLIGEHRNADLEVEFSFEGTTAEEGVHYNVLTDSPVVIEAGSSSADVEIEIIDSGAFENGEVRLNLTIESAGEEVEPAENLKEATVWIQEFERDVELSAQALDQRINDTEVDTELLVTGVTSFDGDYVIVTPPSVNDDYTGAEIIAYTQVGSLSGGNVAVDIDGADPDDYVVHVIREAHFSESSVDDGVISEETAANLAASSDAAPIYHVAQFEWNDESHNGIIDPIGEGETSTITVDVVEILYNGTIGETLISIDLHEVGEEGEIGAFVGISQEDLTVNNVYSDVVVDVVEPVDPGDDAPEREDSVIDETGDYFAMAHLGPAGEDVDGNRIPAQQPALLTTVEVEEENDNGDLVLTFFPVGDFATVTIEENDD